MVIKEVDLLYLWSLTYLVILFFTYRYLFPLHVIICWWLMFLLSAIIFDVGIYQPSLYLQYIVLFFLSSLIFGGFLSLFVIKLMTNNTININHSLKMNYMYLSRKFFYLSSVVIIPFLLYKIYLVYLQNGIDINFATYRNKFYDSSESVIYGNLIDTVMYSVLSTGYAYFFAVFSPILSKEYDEKKIVFVYFFVVLLMCVISAGRFYLYYFIFGYIICKLYYYLFEKEVFIFNINTFFIITVVLFSILSISYLRYDNMDEMISGILRYHVLSFTMLDLKLKEMELGFESTMGIGLFYPLIMILFLIFYPLFPNGINELTKIYRDLGEYINVGNGNVGNAFYTFIYNFYRDGGLISVVLYSVFFGFLINFLFLYKNKNKNTNLILSFLFILVFSMSIFNSKYHSLGFSSALLIHFTLLFLGKFKYVQK